jgi:hypothetical protein
MNARSISWTHLASALCALIAFGHPVSAQSIYSCTDKQGRRLTSDRPIAECLDREQREHNTTGTVRRIVPPNLTADEREAFERKQRQDQMEENRRQDERRRSRALLTRYPDKVAHDKDRATTLLGLQQATEVAQIRIKQLQADRNKLDGEMEFYKKDPSKAPASLRQRVQDNIAALEVQNRFIEGQGQEAARINARFDDERKRLEPLWAGSEAATQAKPR